MTQNRDSSTNRHTNQGNHTEQMKTSYPVTRWAVTRCARRGSNPQPADPKSLQALRVGNRRWEVTGKTVSPAERKWKFADPNIVRSFNDSFHEFVASAARVLLLADMGTWR